MAWPPRLGYTLDVEPRVRYQTDREICATWGPVVIRICDGVRTEIEDLHRVGAVFDELLESHRTVAMLLVLTHGTPLLDPRTQRYGKESMAAYADRLVMGVAVLGLGFWASTMHAALGLFVRVVGRSNMWLENSAERAVERIASELVGLDGEALLDVYRQLWDMLGVDVRRTG